MVTAGANVARASSLENIRDTKQRSGERHCLWLSDVLSEQIQAKTRNDVVKSAGRC